MTTLFAQPYDISASGFYFDNAEDYLTKAKALRNYHGQPVEEFEIQFIDGEAIDAELADAWGLSQCSLKSFFIATEDWSDYQKRCFIIAVGECGYDYDPALNILIGRYKQKLFSFIFKYVQDQDVAYDIVQETFIRVYTKAGSYKSEFAFSTWIYQIAINLCRDRARKQKLWQLVSLETYIGTDSQKSFTDLLEAPLSNVEELVGNRNQLRVLEKEIQKLPHKLKTALLLFTVEGHSQEECAKILNVTAKTIETRVYLARKILTKKIPINFEG